MTTYLVATRLDLSGPNPGPTNITIEDGPQFVEGMHKAEMLADELRLIDDVVIYKVVEVARYKAYKNL